MWFDCDNPSAGYYFQLKALFLLATETPQRKRMRDSFHGENGLDTSITTKEKRKHLSFQTNQISAPDITNNQVSFY